MARRPTIQDLAQRAGVSVSTIDRILNSRDKVRVGTVERVLAAAEELQFYALPALRQRLKPQPDRLKIGFLLQQSHRSLYRTIASALIAAADTHPESLEVVVEHMDDLSPEAVSAHILQLGSKVHALGVVSAEHPRISAAIEDLAARGVPVYGIISELTAACGTGYVGLDNWKVGRTAGWAIAGMCKRPGRVGIVVGNHRYRCQELNESGLRSYIREHASEFILLEPIQTFEDNAISREVTEQLLRREPDLAGLYVAGGGMPGALEAVRASGRAGSIVTVGNDLTDHTRTGLIDNVLTMVFAHPVQRLAAEAIAHLAREVTSGAQPTKKLLAFDVVGPENI